MLLYYHKIVDKWILLNLQIFKILFRWICEKLILLDVPIFKIFFYGIVDKWMKANEMNATLPTQNCG